VHGDALRVCASAERALRDAQAARCRVVGGVMPPDPRPLLSVSEARDAYATASARLRKAKEEERSARRDVEAAKTEIESVRQAVMDSLGGPSAAAAMWNAEANRLEEAAAEARREARLAEQRVRVEFTGTLHELNELQRKQLQGA
jgi:hypothetical protein